MQEVKSKSRSRVFFLIFLLFGICIGVVLVLFIQRLKSNKQPIEQPVKQETVSRTVSAKAKKDTLNRSNNHMQSHVAQNRVNETALDTEEDTNVFVNQLENKTFVLNSSEEEVQQDELLLVRVVSIHSTTVNERKQELDSLLIDKKAPESKNTVRVEFWRSPINYTGYRMNADKLVLFGFYEPEEITFEQKNTGILIQYKNNTFLLEYTDNFKPLHIKQPVNRK